MVKILKLVIPLLLISCATQKPLIDFGGERDYDANVYSSLNSFPVKQIKTIQLQKGSEIKFSDVEGSSLLSYSQNSWAIKKLADFNFSRLILGIKDMKQLREGFSAPYIVFRFIPLSGEEIVIKPNVKVERVESSIWSGEKYQITYNYDFRSINGQKGQVYLQSIAVDPPVPVAVIKGATCTVMITPTMMDTRSCNLPVKSAFYIGVEVFSIK